MTAHRLDPDRFTPFRLPYPLFWLSQKLAVVLALIGLAFLLISFWFYNVAPPAIVAGHRQRISSGTTGTRGGTSTGGPESM